METVRIRDGKKLDPGSGINIPDPQHCLKISGFGVTIIFWLLHIGTTSAINEIGCTQHINGKKINVLYINQYSNYFKQ
jgi:hypothetical protein